MASESALVTHHEASLVDLPPSLLLWTWPSAAPRCRRRQPAKEQVASARLSVTCLLLQTVHTPALSLSSLSSLLFLFPYPTPKSLSDGFSLGPCLPSPYTPSFVSVLNLTFQLLSDPPSAFTVSTDDCFLPLPPHPPFSPCLASAYLAQPLPLGSFPLWSPFPVLSP